MRGWERVLAVLLGATLGGALSHAHAQDPADDPAAGVVMFHDSLSPHGRWVRVEPHGQVWIPAGVAPGWRPYTCGHWVYTYDYGWMWVSDFDDWGPVCFHYGRWAYSPFHGWYWVPGTVWAPAWVAWRCGGGYVGWAPLPPGVSVHLEFGVRHAEVVAIDSYCWAFVPERHVLAPRVAEVAVPVGRNTTIVRGTTNVTRFQVTSGRIANRGLEVEKVEKFTGRPVPRLRVVEERSRPAKRNAPGGDQIAVYRPDLARTEANAARPAEPTRSPASARGAAPGKSNVPAPGGSGSRGAPPVPSAPGAPAAAPATAPGGSAVPKAAPGAHAPGPAAAPATPAKPAAGSAAAATPGSPPGAARTGPRASPAVPAVPPSPGPAARAPESGDPRNAPGARAPEVREPDLPPARPSATQRRAASSPYPGEDPWRGGAPGGGPGHSRSRK